MKQVAIRRGILPRVCRAREGQSLVEFAMVAPLFFLLVFGITDFGRLFFTQVTLQHAVREAGRYAVTGRHETDSSGTTKSRVDSIKQIAAKSAAGLDVTSIQITSDGVSGYAGGPGSTVVVSLTTKLKLITPFIGRYFGPNGEYVFTVSTAFKNEPFDLSSAN